MLVFLLQGLVLGATAAMQPGPLQAFLLSQTLKNGWRRTLPAAFAPLISDGPIVLLVLFILTQTPVWFLQILQIIGGLFLLYLAYGAFYAYKTAVSLNPTPSDTGQQNLFKAALMNFLSPNPYIFWATIAGPIFINGWREAPIDGISFVLGFYVAIIGGFMAFIGLFALTSKLDPRISRLLSLISAIALLLFGLYQLSKGLSFLWT
ncbi:MAG: LysE family transporter [Anaerolineales bacterium]|nr:LysE family transporter [Anaerolineales bacterium]